jgi:hypothetical protein
VDVHDGADRLDQVREEEGEDEDIGGRGRHGLDTDRRLLVAC